MAKKKAKTKKKASKKTDKKAKPKDIDPKYQEVPKATLALVLPDCIDCGENEYKIIGQKSLVIECVWCEYKLTAKQKRKMWEDVKCLDKTIDESKETPEDTPLSEDDVKQRLQGNHFNTVNVAEIPEDLTEQFQNLTEKQKLFCEYYIIDFNGAEAARKAGYSEKGAKQEASRMLTNADLMLYLQALKEERMIRVKYDQDDVITTLQKIQNRALQAYPVRDREGMPTGEWTYDGNNAIKSTELLGRHVNMFNVELTGKEGQPIRFLSDISLEALSETQLNALEEILLISQAYKEKEKEITSSTSIIFGEPAWPSFLSG